MDAHHGADGRDGAGVRRARHAQLELVEDGAYRRLPLVASGARYVEPIERRDSVGVVATEEQVGHVGLGQVFVDLADDESLAGDAGLSAIRVQAVLAVDNPAEAVNAVDDGKTELRRIERAGEVLAAGAAEGPLRDALQSGAKGV